MASRGAFLSKAYSAARKAGLPDPAARVAAAQAALESNYGKSAPGNNFFGIKAGKSWKGATQSLKTWEVIDGKKVSIRDNFRKYADFKQSFKDWANLVGRRWPGVLTAPTFDDAVAALNAGLPGGYATDPNYAAKLGRINGQVGDALAYSLPDTMDVPKSLAQATAIETAYRDNMRALDVLPSAPVQIARPSTPTPLTALNKASPPSRFPGVPAGLITRAPLDAIPASLTAAPVGRVERAPLPDIGKFTTPARSLQHPVSAPKPANLPAVPAGTISQRMALPPATPNAQTLAAQYAQYQPSKVTSMPTVAGMPSIPAPTGLPAAKQVAQPLQHPISVPAAPVPVLAPALAPPKQVKDYPVAEAPVAPPAPPAATAYDVYSGLATQAKDNTGQNTVGMLPDGTTTVTNKYGVTTGMTPYGKQTAVGSIPGISGPLAKNVAKLGIPAAGSLAFGPIGGLLGSLAVGLMNKPGGLLSNVRNVDTMFGNIQAAAVNPGLRSFPDAPSGGYRGSASFSNRSAEGMRGISPRAAADISAGRAGLF